MKKKTELIFALAVLALLSACRQGNDPVSEIAPEADQKPPAVEIVYPKEGTQIQVNKEVTGITFKTTVTDDVELKSILAYMDEKQIGAFNVFKDYRRSLDTIPHQLSTGRHVFKITATDLSGKVTNSSVNFVKLPPYYAMKDEVFYMPLNSGVNDKAAIADGIIVGKPSFDAGKKEQAYFGATNAYISYDLTDNLKKPEMSYSFWYKLNSTPDQAGLLTIGTVDEGDKKHGLRLYREGASAAQTIKLSVGIGAAESVNDGGIIPAGAEWAHIAVVISKTASIIYINGVEVGRGALASPISWEGCASMSVASGEPNGHMNHKSDLSGYDELRIFSKAMTEAEVAALKNM